MSSLTKLCQDLPLYILELTDIRTVLALSQVNKYFRTVAELRHLWYSLIKQLNARSLLQLPPSDLFSRYSTEELIRELKHGALGPETWRKPTSKPLKASRTIRFPLTLETKDRYLRLADLHIQLLVDGRHLIVTHTHYLELWDISTGLRKCLLSAGSRYAVQHIQAQGVVVVALLRPGALEIVRIELQTGACTPLACFPLLESDPATSFVFICDDFVVTALGQARLQVVILINWREETYVRIPGSLWPHKPILVPGFLILPQYISTIFPKPISLDLHLHIYTLDIFARLCCPLSTFSKYYTGIDFLPIIRQPFELDGTPFSDAAPLHIAAHPSLLDADAHILSIYASEPLAANPLFRRRLRAALMRFRLQAWRAPSLRHLSAVRAAPNLILSSLSYAGYAAGGRLNAANRQRDVIRVDAAATPVVRPRRLHTVVAPYGGTVLVLGMQSREIFYYV
jgi:hypothetical protein